jgi:nucleoside-diphosphate-sugar epimerase
MAEREPTRRALVTGASGFIGSRLARALLADGWEVHAVVRPSSKLEQLTGIAERVTFHLHDGSTDSLIETLGAARPHVVFHLAALFITVHRPDQVVPLLQSNVVFGTQLLEAMTTTGSRRLVSTGTFSQHYDNRDYAPTFLYDATKKALDDIVQFYVESAGLSAVTLELYDTYGPGDPRVKLFALLRAAAESGRTLDMSPGEQLLNLVYVDDVVRGYRIAADRLRREGDQRNERFALSSGRPLPLREVVRIYQAVTGRAVPVRFGGRPYRPREIMVPWNRGELLPGWSPLVPLEEGILRTEGLDAR